jgi:hypothetical protein
MGHTLVTETETEVTGLGMAGFKQVSAIKQAVVKLKIMGINAAVARQAGVFWYDLRCETGISVHLCAQAPQFRFPERDVRQGTRREEIFGYVDAGIDFQYRHIGEPVCHQIHHGQ